MKYEAMLERYRPGIISNLQEMIRIRSVETPAVDGKPFGEGVDQALRLALETASTLGLTTVDRNGMIGYAEYGSGKEMVAVLAHLDVVPEGKGWTFPPFGAEIHDGKMYGRGTTDDKGPAIAALWALKILAEENHRLSKRIRIIFGTNEESGFRGIKWYAENEEIPVAGFTPDIHEGIVFAEKGGLHVQMDIPVNREGSVFLEDFRSGEAVNIVPDLAEAVFSGEISELDSWADALESQKGYLPLGGEVIREKERLTIRAKGKAAHASLPENGINAIAALCCFLGRSPEPGIFNTLSQLFRDPAFGKELGIEMTDEVSGPLTCNPGLASFSEGTLSITLDIRHPVTFTGDHVEEKIQGILGPLGINFRVTSRANPLHVPKDSQLIKDLSDVFFEVTGKRPELKAMGGGTYAKALPNVVAFAPFPNGLPELAHQADEYIDIEDFLASILVIKNAMIRLAR